MTLLAHQGTASSGRIQQRTSLFQDQTPFRATKPPSVGGPAPTLPLRTPTETEQEEQNKLPPWERKNLKSLTKSGIEANTKRDVSIIAMTDLGTVHRDIKQQGQTRFIIDALSVTNFLENLDRLTRDTGMQWLFASMATFTPPPAIHTETPEPQAVHKPNPDLKPERPCKELITEMWKMQHQQFVTESNEIDYTRLNQSQQSSSAQENPNAEDSLENIRPMLPQEEWVIAMMSYDKEMGEYKASIKKSEEYEIKKKQYEDENTEANNFNSLVSSTIEVRQALWSKVISALHLEKHPLLKGELDISFEYEGTMIEKPLTKENIAAITHLLRQKHTSIHAANVTGTLREVFTQRPVSALSYIIPQTELTWNKMKASKVLDLFRDPENDQIIQVALAMTMVPLDSKDRGEIMDLGMTLVNQYLQGERDPNIYHHPTSGFKYLLQQINLRNAVLTSTSGRSYQDSKADQDLQKPSSRVPGAYMAEQGSDTGGGGNRREKAVLVSGLPTFKNEAGKDQVKLKAEVNRLRYNFTQPYTVRGAVTQVPWGCTSSHCTICYKKEGKGFVRTEKVCKDTTPCLANCALCRNYGHYWGTCPFLDVQDNKYRDMYESVVSNVPKQKAAVHQAASAMLASCEDPP